MSIALALGDEAQHLDLTVREAIGIGGPRHGWALGDTLLVGLDAVDPGLSGAVSAVEVDGGVELIDGDGAQGATFRARTGLTPEVERLGLVPGQGVAAEYVDRVLEVRLSIL